MQASAVVPADEFQFGFLLLTSTLYFQLSICTGQTSNEFPAFANTQRYMPFYLRASFLCGGKNSKVQNCFHAGFISTKFAVVAPVFHAALLRQFTLRFVAVWTFNHSAYRFCFRIVILVDK